MADDPHDSTAFPSTIAYRGSLPKVVPPERLGQYRVLKALGRGGMGVVYLAEDTQLHRKAALKVMRADYASDPEALARFLREAQAAARLKHDHIVTIYQVDQQDGIPFLAMEYLAGKSLEEWLRPDRKATIVETLLISKQVARGLAAAHGAGLIHRDIKPANLWLEAPRGRVKILDFGLARHVQGELTNLTQDGSVLGTPAFMAPEQARGDVVDHRCDLFSLGCVMYRLVTGQLPFSGPTTFAVLSAIATHTPPPPIQLRGETPPRLSALVERLLAKQPEQRPISAQAVLDELAEIEKEVKQPQTPPSLLTPSAVPAAILPAAATTSVPAARPVAISTAETLNLPMPTVRTARPVKRKAKSVPAAWLAVGGGVVLVVLVGLLALMMNQPRREEAARRSVERNPGPPPKEIGDASSDHQEPVRVVPRAETVASALPAVSTSESTKSDPPTRPVVNPPQVSNNVSTPSPLSITTEDPTPASLLRPLSELNTSADETSPWLSRDGLEIYFGREWNFQGPQTFRATRASIDAPFGPDSVVNSLKHAVLSQDGLLMVGLMKEGGSEQLYQSTRKTTTDSFAAPQKIRSLQGQLAPKSPWLSADGKRLIFQRDDKAGDYAGKDSPEAMRHNEFVMCRWESSKSEWSSPVRLPMSDHSLYTDALTWPSLSDDQLTLLFCNGGGRQPEVMYATRSDPLKSFVNPHKVLVDGQPLLGRAPRYHEATGQLIFSRDKAEPGQTQDFDLWVLNGFVPESSEPAPKPAKKSAWPKDAVAFGGHHYKYFPGPIKWHDAKARCEKLEGHLAIVDSAAENGFLARLVVEGRGTDAWLGYTDEAQEGKWLTIEGKPLAYTNWFTGQPNNKQNLEHYVLMSGQKNIDWRWSDQPDQALQPHNPGYLCEWEPFDDEEPEGDFTSLFDGKSLAGWQGDTSGYSVENGVLVGKGTRSTLYTEKQYADFELQFEFRLSAGANSGIAFRSPRIAWAELSSQGNELQILDDATVPIKAPWQRHGSLYGVLAAKEGQLKPTGQWNRQIVICRGDKLQVRLNGVEILAADLSSLPAGKQADGNNHPGLRRKSGYLGLMGHTNRVEFRDIKVRELKE